MTIAVLLLAANMVVMPMDCAQVQGLVQQYGRVRTTAWAVEQIMLGTYSWREFRAAKRCLDRPKGKS